ncbi:MAG TPA: hypothetical protein VFS09_06480 [Candidatus Eisenbacteria bacterium]|nr:hypothetical protein [Candidatus Eisenbacteria bacterium]
MSRVLMLAVAAAMLPVVPALILYWRIAEPWKRPLRAEVQP